MFKWLDKTSNFLLKFAYDCMKVFLIFVMLARAFNKNFNISGLFLYTALIFLASILMSYIISILSDKAREKYRYLGLMGIVGSLLVGLRFNPTFTLSGQMLMGAYFILVWMNGIGFVRQKDNTHFFFRRFFQTFLFMVFISLSVGIGQLRWYLTDLQPFYTVFFLSAIMNLVSMNLKSAYQESSANIMQKSKKVLVFNIVSIFLLSFSFLGLMVFFSNMSLGWVENIIRMALMPVSQFGAWFSSYVRQRAIKNQHERPQGSVQGWSDRVKEMREDLAQDLPVETEAVWDHYIEWFFFIGVIALLMGLAYYLTRQIEKRRFSREDHDLGEVRESMLSASYLRQHISKRIQTVNEKLATLFNRNQEELPRVRSLYKSYMAYIAHKGVVITEDLTPNEILKRDLQKRGKKKPQVQLTKIYNAYKYGEMDEADLDQDLLESIENALEKSEM